MAGYQIRNQYHTHYLYSSASNYRDDTGILPVTIIDLGITDFYIFSGGQHD